LLGESKPITNAQPLITGFLLCLFVNKRVAIADVLVVLIDVGKHFQSIKSMGLNKFIQEHLFDLLTPIQSDIMENILKTKSLLIGLNKTDLLSTSEIAELNRLKQPNDQHITHMSCLNKHGLDTLLDGLKSRLDSL
jgi:tRNA U34 5-carboxymethylaminomethyl modifying GTPase MnmE/TrmE